MKNIEYKGVAIIIGFLLTWYVLTTINWMDLFRVEHYSQTTEEKLGDFYWELIQKSETEIDTGIVALGLDSIFSRICTANKIDQSKLKIHILEKEEINAFALPSKHIILFTGLIKAANNESELSGVIGHELAHIEKNHVMKKLVKEVGLSALITITTGSKNAEIVRETLKLLSSSAYDRTLERDADAQSVEYLINADIDPAPFADFLYGLSTEDNTLPVPVYWVSTHPDSKLRAEHILEMSKDKDLDVRPILSESTWIRLQNALK